MAGTPATSVGPHQVGSLVALSVVAVLLSASTTKREVIATVGDHEITTSDLHTAGAIKGDTASVRQALLHHWRQALLATEARALLKLPPTLPDSQAADALRRRLFNPGQLCSRIPEARLRQRYEETAWRFVAPPAWTVDDVQLLCCRNPRDCQTSEVQGCLEVKRTAARELHGTFGGQMNAEAFKAHYESIQEASEAAYKRYVFYFDPTGAGAVHWRLQEVDRPIAEAVAKLSPGDVAPVVTTRFGHHILRLESARPAIDLRWDDPRAHAILRTELCPTAILEAEERYVTDLSELLPIRLRGTSLSEAFGVQMNTIGLTGSAPR